MDEEVQKNQQAMRSYMNLRANLVGVRNLRQVHYRRNKGDHGTRKETLADQILALKAMHGDPLVGKYLHYIETRSDQSPIFIMFSKTLLNFMYYNCTSRNKHPAIMSIDRTFNLSEFDVTLVVFQPRTLLKKDSSSSHPSHPIMIGAICIHQGGQTYVYETLAQTLQRHFPMADLAYYEVRDTNCNTNRRNFQESLYFGSDQENAIRKAFAKTFPSAMFALCTWHIMNCLRRKLQSMAVSDEVRHKIYPYFNGRPQHRSDQPIPALLDATSEEEFEATVDALHRDLGPSTEERWFQQLSRFINHLLTLLKENNFRMVAENTVPTTFKTNMSESINATLKQDADHKKQTLPNLARVLARRLRNNEDDLQGALHGVGSLRPSDLVPKNKYTTSYLWDTSLSDTKKNKMLQKFMIFGVRTRYHTSDSQEQVCYNARGGRRPGQLGPQTPKTHRRNFAMN